MIFLPKGQTVTVDMRKLSGPSAVAWWFNPRTGGASRVKEKVSTAGTATFTSPTAGSSDDWMLVLDDAHKAFGPPGAAPYSDRSTNRVL